LISEDRLTQALKYLAITDEPCAKAKALLTGLEEQSKTVFAIAYLNAAGTVEERKSRAYVSETYKEHLKKIEDATYDFELMRNKRNTESTIVECWRSMNANRRVGNL
jgi:hypothetical protein